MILDTIYDVPLTSVLFVSVTQNSHKYVPCAINYLYQRCLVMGVRPTGFYNVAKNRSDIYSWRDQSRTVISIKVSWILMSGLIVVNGPLTITWSVLTQKHMIFYSLSPSPPLARYFPQFWHLNYPHRSLQGHWCQLSDSYYKNTWTLSLWKLHLV